MIVNRRIGVYILLRESLRSLLALFAWDLLVVILFQLFHQEWMEQPALPISLIGSALVLFMNVRNNAAYSRWWEGRSLWGMVTNNCRSFGRQAGTLLNNRPDLACAMAAYAHSLRGSLGDIDVSADVRRLLPEKIEKRIRGISNQPNAILYEIGVEVNAEVARQNIDGAVHGQIDRILSDMANAQGGLERIRKTPLAIQFSGLPRFLTICFCLVLPLSMVQSLGWITPLGSSLVGFLFVALDKIGHDLEEPFRNNTAHTLPMKAMAITIEIDLLQPLGLPAPPPLQPEGGVLI
ncbi:bestrophin family protein [Entomobacter blattae]|uniref:Bestrophin, RFP-TM, chloride channel n=1 Tax=Entomobacter blattae TaxID=2762277 RepID=A0A7H1NTF5_9PROT|nr:bestrophin family ion channel [Entomobacter blattae]QNT79065.1 Bestrophin, RFP-TM, chloride channel [Entomobacter blattae]